MAAVAADRLPRAGRAPRRFPTPPGLRAVLRTDRALTHVTGGAADTATCAGCGLDRTPGPGMYGWDAMGALQAPPAPAAAGTGTGSGPRGRVNLPDRNSPRGRPRGLFPRRKAEPRR